MLPSFSPHAFVRQGGVLTDLGTLLGDSASGASGIKGLGLIVGFSAGDTEQSACLWQGGQPVDLNTRISDPAWQLAVANTINDAGQIVGYGLLNGALHGFLLTPIEQDVRGDTSAAQRKLCDRLCFTRCGTLS